MCVLLCKSHPETIQEEGLQPEEGEDRTRAPLKTVMGGGMTCLAPPLWEGKDEQEIRKLERLEKAGIRVLPAAVRYSRSAEGTSPSPSLGLECRLTPLTRKCLKSAGRDRHAGVTLACFAVRCIPANGRTRRRTLLRLIHYCWKTEI